MQFFLIFLFFVVNRAAAFAATAIAAPTPAIISTKDVVRRVAVTGATGRTGRLVVQELLGRGVEVVAIVRDLDKAKDIFDENNTSGLTVAKCNLSSESEIGESLQGCDAAIWCATGFSDAQGPPFLEKIKRLVGIAGAPKTSIDAVGIPAVAKFFLDADRNYPKIVMLSSAGVTRPSWDATKKARFPGSAEIPIVRLNPFGILNIKAESEEKLRNSGSPYCVVRPAGLNDNWPSGSRPVFSQGDVAVGRINRKDVACILADVLSTREATGKTFEVITLAGYPPADSIAPALNRLRKDTEGLPNEEILDATYITMQQLLPGEKQDSANIALGQTYEQMDQNEQGRFGPRGAEKVEKVALKPSS